MYKEKIRFLASVNKNVQLQWVRPDKDKMDTRYQMAMIEDNIDFQEVNDAIVKLKTHRLTGEDRSQLKYWSLQLAIILNG